MEAWQENLAERQQLMHMAGIKALFVSTSLTFQPSTIRRRCSNTLVLECEAEWNYRPLCYIHLLSTAQALLKLHDTWSQINHIKRSLAMQIFEMQLFLTDVWFPLFEKTISQWHYGVIARNWSRFFDSTIHSHQLVQISDWKSFRFVLIIWLLVTYW